ncbi:MAG: hypothetical protein DRG39_00700 [Deltaproteobacteria bacterium]|nr:MAG: hypothetical protein DRG39_00700 [Deltaproteobacteria bacterium]
MKDKYKKRWIFAGIIWSFALTAFVFNLIKIQSYLREKEKLIAQERIKEFIRKNEPVLKNIIKERSKLYDPVISPKIGLLKVKELLKRIIEKNGLESRRIEHEEVVAGINSIDLTVICNGSVKNLIETIHDIDSNYPYLVINAVKLDLDRNKSGKFIIKLKYNFMFGSQ